jgi:cytochrome c oxidase subunit 1
MLDHVTERPVFELHYPLVSARMLAETHIGRRATLGESPESVHSFGPRTEADR